MPADLATAAVDTSFGDPPDADGSRPPAPCRQEHDMPSSIHHITFDCHDVELVGRFWADVVGYVDDPDDPNEPGDPNWVLVPPDGVGPGLLFLGVPDDKVVKNRVHLDLQPSTGRDAEVARLIELGATQLADHRRPDGSGFVVLADPEGNEFCVERSAAERASA